MIKFRQSFLSVEGIDNEKPLLFQWDLAGRFGSNFRASVWKSGHGRCEAFENTISCYELWNSVKFQDSIYGLDCDEQEINAWYDAWKESLALKELLKGGSKSPAKGRL